MVCRSVCESSPPSLSAPTTVPPVTVKASSWLHHPGASTYDWAAAAADSYMTQHHRFAPLSNLLSRFRIFLTYFHTHFYCSLIAYAILY